LVFAHFSRRIVGWSMASHLRTSLVLDALDMALGQRRPENVVHHPTSPQAWSCPGFVDGYGFGRAGGRLLLS